jgi:hypothetical protein
MTWTPSETLPTLQAASPARFFEAFQRTEIRLRPGFLADPEDLCRLRTAELSRVSQCEQLSVNGINVAQRLVDADYAVGALRRLGWRSTTRGGAPGLSTKRPSRAKSGLGEERNPGDCFRLAPEPSTKLKQRFLNPAQFLDL